MSNLSDIQARITTELAGLGFLERRRCYLFWPPPTCRPHSLRSVNGGRIMIRRRRPCATMRGLGRLGQSAILDQDVGMIKVSAAELKSRLGTYLGMVRAGATIDVTSYRQSVARLVPAVDEEVLIEEPTEPPEVLAGLGRLPSGRSIPAVAALLADRRRR